MSASKKLVVKIHNLKAVSELNLSLDIKPGLTCFVGGNGAGKSTILNVLSQLINKANINKLFFDEKREDSSVEIDFGGDSCTWIQKNGRWMKTGDFEGIKGFHESGIVYGSRFSNSSLNNIHKYCEHYTSDNDSYVDAPDFVYKNLGKILKGNESYYKGLKTITKADLSRKAKELPKESENYLIRAEKPFLLRKDSGFITQYKMSSGEYLLLKILDYIYYRITYASDKGENKEPFLVIIDEVEIALHPSAQKRLIQFCNKVSKEHSICIIFSSHSREIINSLHPNQIHLLESHLGKISVTTPCYPHYAIRGIYEASGYDYVVCVEDNLAKRIVSETIKKKGLSNNKLVNVSALGGWREVLNFTHEFKINGLFNNTKMVIVLDGDIEDRFHAEYGSPCNTCNYHDFVKDNHSNIKDKGFEPPKPSCKLLPNSYPYYQDVAFLPISSLEKEIRSKLITNPDYDFISTLENLNYFGQSSVSDLVSQYEAKAEIYFSSDNFKARGIKADLLNFDADGKILWRLLSTNIKPGVTPDDLISYLCDVFATRAEGASESWEHFERQLAILLQKPLP
ncbi:AAA family ATPase [Pseudomonas asturiensis]|uniref:AAA family ATPase n=1 Tax=Pseudomonas asturiensis TaxID=1190415 RepID=A0ABX6HGL6_9PSED|nr:AAA family ATPase [Pseudomonas asturiensis]QHF04745.1 AAA family ATPase [Pseudomonas asturiensis]